MESIMGFGKKENDLLQQTDRIVIYGFGEIGKSVYKEVSVLEKPIDVLDRNCDSLKSDFCDVNMYTIDSYDRYELSDALFIVTSAEHADEMVKRLMERGVNLKNVIYPYDVILRQNEIYRRIIAKRVPRKDLRFVVCITEHCNLNCARCDHFSPLSKEWYMDVNDFERDMKRMAEIFWAGGVSVIDIEGGEPLLHKEIVRFMNIARHYFPANETIIKVYTNGLLLQQMGDEFWRECVDSNIIIRVTKYPISFDYDKLKKDVVGHGVEFEFANDEYVDKVMIQQNLDIEGKQDKYDSFHNCYMANGNCAELRLGKFYQCNIIANLHIFNEYFNQDLKVEKSDYIDIYSHVTRDDFFEYLCAPAPACRFCKTKEWRDGNMWSVSQKTIDEWT